ncbi:uncharacterized protein RJT21DRAFT_117534 [Scheffersomyces amazonensis]|uniref:uncharacterized protein n=1 Tax=Scheffersomyces amazonensis TaxID=1078765 RepID=UPI00315CBD45
MSLIMDEINLSILGKLSPACIDKLTGAEEDVEDQLIYRSISSNNVLEPPVEQTYYTKVKKGSTSKVYFDNAEGLRELNINIRQKPSKNRNRGKLSAKKSMSGIIGADLSRNFHEYTPETKQSIYSLEDLYRSVQFLVENKSRKLSSIKILSLRRNLMTLLMIPVKRHPARFRVIYWQDLIIIDYDWEFENDTHDFDKSQYSGFKFEDVITKPKPVDEGSVEDLSLELEKLTLNDEKSSYYTVVESKLNGIPILFTAEIDAGIKESTPGIDNYVELKTHTNISTIDMNTRPPYRLQSKLLTTYCQNKFINAKYGVIGFRSPQYRLTSIKSLENNEIGNFMNKYPMLISDGISVNGGRLFKWYSLIVTWLHDQIKTRGQKNRKEDVLVFHLECVSGETVLNTRLSLKEITDKTESSRLFSTTVPQWFQEFVKKQSEGNS